MDDPAVWVWTMLMDDDVEFAERARLCSIIRDFAEEKMNASMLRCVRGRAFGMSLRAELLKQAHVFARQEPEKPTLAGGRRLQ